MLARTCVAVASLALAALGASRPADPASRTDALLLAPEPIPGDPPLPRDLAGARLRITRCRTARYGQAPPVVEIEARLEAPGSAPGEPPSWLLRDPTTLRSVVTSTGPLPARNQVAFVADGMQSRVGMRVLGLPDGERRLAQAELLLTVLEVPRWTRVRLVSKAGESSQATGPSYRLTLSNGTTSTRHGVFTDLVATVRVGSSFGAERQDPVLLLEANDARGLLVEVPYPVDEVSLPGSARSLWQRGSEGNGRIAFPATATLHVPADGRVGETRTLRFVLPDLALR